MQDRLLAALMERLGFGGREMAASGHSKDFVQKVVQPSLVGLMDGSVSTLAPLFATVFATGDTRVTFLVGLAAAAGAAISVAFSEGLSDDGTLTGRGSPVVRGAITGLTTFVGGVLTHPSFPPAGCQDSTVPRLRGRRHRAAGDLPDTIPILLDELPHLGTPGHPRRRARLRLRRAHRQRIVEVTPAGLESANSD
jgi:hypothetical protein